MPTKAERVLRFLLERRDETFESGEIADRLDATECSTWAALERLHDRGLVGHERSGWTIGDLEAVRNAFVYSSTVSFLEGELGTESRAEWLEATEKDE